jgi:serine phosphatase RsbU (regulator of sigma subunit)
VLWAGANNPLWILCRGKITEIKADKLPVAYSENAGAFTTHEINVEPGSYLYLPTDGYSDQFGGPKAKKFKTKALKEFLTTLTPNSAVRQVELLYKNFVEWKGPLDQVDDVSIAVIRI